MKVYLYVILIAMFLVVGWYSTLGIKSQLVRLMNIFVYGPSLIWLSFTTNNLLVKVLLIILGSTTISYNTRNYISSK